MQKQIEFQHCQLSALSNCITPLAYFSNYCHSTILTIYIQVNNEYLNSSNIQKM